MSGCDIDKCLSVGIDIGGTNTDGCVCDLLAYTNKRQVNDVVCSVFKTSTTKPSPLDGIELVLKTLLKSIDDVRHIKFVSIGTTAFVNAIVERSPLLCRVGVMRLCSSSTTALPPFCDMPEGLQRRVRGEYALCRGGYEFNGEVIDDIDDDEIERVATKWCTVDGIRNVVVSGVFSPVNPEQELQVETIVRRVYEENNCSVNITLGHRISQLGLLERENASVLNASIIPYATTTIASMQKAVKRANLKCPLFLTQNDGTLISASAAKDRPVVLFSCGPTNSMRGAAWLCGKKDAIVVDIGGTTSDIGVLVNGVPRQAGVCFELGGVRTKFSLPDVLSVGLGGGSVVQVVSNNGNDVESITIGPTSVGSELTKQSQCFGGNVMTMTDVCVANGQLVGVGDASIVTSEVTRFADNIMTVARRMIEEGVDSVRTSIEELPLIVVGGGAAMIDATQPIKGCSDVILPEYANVANAIGAAIAQVSVTLDQLVEMDEARTVIEHHKQAVIESVVKLGSLRESVKLVEVSEVPVAYSSTNSTRLTIRAIGNLDPHNIPEGDGTIVDDTLEQEKMHAHGLNAETQTSQITTTNGTPSGEKQFDDTGAWMLNEHDVEWIAAGAAILGCGGGGSPYIASLVAKRLLKQGAKMRVVQHRDVEDSSLFVPIAFMGAPVVLIEKLMTGHECLLSVETMKNSVSGQIGGLVAAEVGGFNALVPLIVGAMCGLNILDADGMGRAFPELQMFVPFMNGCECAPSVLSDEKGNSVTLSSLSKLSYLERIMRQVVVQFGAAAALAVPPIRSGDVDSVLITGTTTMAWRLGRAVHYARREKQDVVETITCHMRDAGTPSRCVFRGKVIDVSRKTTQGFDQGGVVCEDENGRRMSITFRNENLVARLCENADEDLEQSQVVATVPDLISIVESDSGRAVTTEEVRFGLRVAVIAIRCSDKLLTPDALKVVGPRAFKFDLDYTPFDKIQ